MSLSFIVRVNRTLTPKLLGVRLSSSGIHSIKMPGIMNSKEGTVNSWAKKVGDPIYKGDRLCEIALPVATIGIDAKEDGILAKIIVGEYQSAPADTDIALYALSREHYMEYLADSMADAAQAERLAVAAEMEELKQHKPDAAALMRAIKHLINSGRIKSGSEFAKKLQSLARKGNPELMAAFQASYEGSTFNEDTFDIDFFLENARDIIGEAEHTD